jgi:hypothetical protein
MLRRGLLAPLTSRVTRATNSGNGDPANCPLCQSFAHAGQFVHGERACLCTSLVNIHFIVLKDILPALFAVSHSWHGRAPPQS